MYSRNKVAQGKEGPILSGGGRCFEQRLGSIRICRMSNSLPKLG